MTVVAVACRRWKSLPNQNGSVVGALSDYLDALAMVNVASVLVPFQAESLALSVMDQCDGLLLAGGENVDSGCECESYDTNHQKTDRARDELEILLLNYALSLRLPVLAICRGLHLLNIVCGGTIAHLNQVVPSPVRHTARWQEGEIYVHDICLVEGSLLSDLLDGARKIQVNGNHTYCVRKLGKGLRIAATSPDDIVEAIEVVDGGFCMGVQWHPECLVLRDDSHALALFRAFAEACTGFENRKFSAREREPNGAGS